MKELMLVSAIVVAQLQGGCGSSGSASPVDAAPMPPDTGATAARCGRTQPDPGPGDGFARAKYAMVAIWNGTATTPWVAPYKVEISFAADGSYEAHTVDHSAVSYAVTPFYYDRDPEHDRYELLDLLANGDATGNIYLEWLPSPDDLKAIRFNGDLTHLHFEYYHFGYGPVVYELDCSS